MTPNQHFCLIVTSYKNAIQKNWYSIYVRSVVWAGPIRWITSRTALENWKRKSNWSAASTFRWRRTGNIWSVPRRFPRTCRPYRVLTPRAKNHFARPPRGAASMDNLRMLPVQERLSFSILSGRKIESIGRTQKIRTIGISDSIRRRRR